MTNEIKNVPELRFPEFNEQWEMKKLKYISSINPKLDSNFPSSFNYIDLESVNKGKINKTSEFTNENAPSRAQRVAQKGDVFFQTVRPYQQNNFVFLGASIPTVVSTGYAQIRSNINSSYIYNLLLTTTFLNKVLVNCTGSNYPAINSNDLSNILIMISTNKDEQKKIGDFFSKLDRQIELEEQKLEKLEEQKKGYMQQIFSQQLRFKDENGNDYPGWKEYVLGETGNTYSGLSSKTKEDFGYGDSYFITYMNVFKNTIAKANMTEKVNIQENEKQNKVNYKDILFTTSSEVPEETGMSSIWLYKENNVYLNSFCFGFHVTCDDIEPIYLTRFLRSEKMRKQITILSQGSTRFNISKKEVMKLKIDVPNLEEQTKIVNFL